MKIEVTKCYLVQVKDKDGNEVACDYVFCDNRKDAYKQGRELKKSLSIKEE